jgi:acyl-CoA synthetase (AMP-forming)/AMP-acid ligase II/aryl carrier-like protein
LTRGALKQVVTSLSSEFARAGCGHGDIVAIVLDNSVAFVASFLALVSIGAVVAPVSTDLTISEYTYSLTNIKPRLVILSKDAAESAAAAAVRNVGMESAFIFEDEGGNVLLNAPKGGLLAGSLKIFRKKVVPEDFAVVLQHTEGTSASSPYAYLLTHSNILAGAAAITDGFQLTAEDKTLVSMPMCHTQGLLYSLVPALATGGEVVIPAEGKFSAALFWSNIQDQGVSYAIMVPTAVALLLRHKTAYEAAGRPALRFIAASCGAGLMPAGTREEVENEFGVPVLDSLGIPESCSFVACNTLFCDSPEVGTFGRPCRGIEVSVRNSQGAEVSGTGEMGSVLVRGAAVSTAHLQEGKIISPPPEMANGWLNLHRQGYIDTRGTLTVSTDSKLINQAGNKLEPCEAEAALEGLAGAERIAVFAVEHALMGQVVGVALLLDGPDEVITNEEVCMYATASQHPLPARWLPACTVLVPLIQDWPSSAPTSDLAQAFGLPVLSGRSNATFIYTASNGLSRQDQASSAAAAGSAGGVSFMRRASTKVLKSSTSFFLAKERQLLLDLESSVIYSYATVLNVNIEDLESESNFFDYGASLQILALLAEIKRRTGISLSQSDAFIRPTIAQLAACLLSKKQEALEGSASGGKSDPPPVVPVSQRLGWQPASYGQEQMCLANEQSGAGAAYNMPYCVKLSGILNVPALHAAVLSTIRAEEGLRSLGRLNFEAMQAEQRVVLESESESCLDFVEHSARNPEEALEIVEREQAYLFDLEHGPIVRVNLIKISPKMHYVLINFHHLNIDGWSQALHRHLVLEAYVAHATAAALGQPPPPLPPAHSITYLDFSVWQRKWLGEQGAAEHQIEYWKKELADAPMLDMPFDRPRTALVSENGGKVDIRIPAGIVTEWRKLLASNGCTLFMGALSIFHVLLHRW